MSRTIKILFLASNPLDTSRLRLDEEIRAIDQALRQAAFRDRFDIEQHWAVRVGDLQDCLLRYQPDIVHFSGHGSETSEIILEDEFGDNQPVPARALSGLFSVLKDNIRCVVLNACYSEQQAQAIAAHIDCVVGMSDAIGDLSAIKFSAAFYRALGYGRDVKTAFDLGCNLIDLAGLNEQDTPKLLAVKSNPKNIMFVQDIRDSTSGKTVIQVGEKPTYIGQVHGGKVHIGDRNYSRIDQGQVSATDERLIHNLGEDMPGISSNLIKRLKDVLLRCGPFASDRELRAVFTDRRLYPWRDKVPTADNAASRVEAIIDFLHNKRSDTQDNALVLLLYALRDRIDRGDACYGELAGLATELEREVKSLVKPAKHSPNS